MWNVKRSIAGLVNEKIMKIYKAGQLECIEIKIVLYCVKLEREVA